MLNARTEGPIFTITTIVQVNSHENSFVPAISRHAYFPWLFQIVNFVPSCHKLPLDFLLNIGSRSRIKTNERSKLRRAIQIASHGMF